MTFAMATTALMVITMATAAAFVLSPFVVLVVTVGVAILTVTMATTTARASAHLLLHAVSNLLISRSHTLFNGKTEVLVDSRKKGIKLLASLKETAAGIILNHILTESIKLSNLLFRRRHAGHVLIAQLFTVFIHLAEQIGSLGILVKKTNASISRNNFLTLSKSRSELSGQFDKLGGKRCISHNGMRLALNS